MVSEASSAAFIGGHEINFNSGAENLKRSTFDKYCLAIKTRLKAINGRYYTPGYSAEYLDFISIYIVGSYAKRAAEPNDLDLLISTRGGGKMMSVYDDNCIIDKKYLRSTGIKTVRDSLDAGFIWLTKGMKKVHRLDARRERTVFDTKIELYVHPLYLPETV